MTGVVETSSITIRNSAVYQQLLCIGQQCHNQLSSIKSAAITNQSFNTICNSQCQKYNDNQSVFGEYRLTPINIKPNTWDLYSTEENVYFLEFEYTYSEDKTQPRG